MSDISTAKIYDLSRFIEAHEKDYNTALKEVKAGYDCGLVFEGFDQMKEQDIVEAYIMVEVPR